MQRGPPSFGFPRDIQVTPGSSAPWQFLPSPSRVAGCGAGRRLADGCSALDVSGLAQCAELCWQLRGLAGRRQVPGAKVALQHNLGLGGAVVVTLFRMGFPRESR